MKTQPERDNLLNDLLARCILERDCVRILWLLVKSLHWFDVVGINLDRPIVDLAHGLDFDVVAPFARRLLFLYVIIETICYEVAEILLLRLNVFHALYAHESVLLLVTVRLERDRPEQAVAIVAHLDNLPARCEHVVLEFLLLCFLNGPPFFERKLGLRLLSYWYTAL